LPTCVNNESSHCESWLPWDLVNRHQKSVQPWS